MSGDPLAIPSAHELMSRAMEASPRAYEAFARAIAGADPGLGADFAWAVTHPEPGTLDAAWAEAEAALPEGWALRIMACMHDGAIGPWKVSAGEDLSRYADVPVYVEGDPAAALRALAAKLREVGR